MRKDTLKIYGRLAREETLHRKLGTRIIVSKKYKEKYKPRTIDLLYSGETESAEIAPFWFWERTNRRAV